MPTYTTAQDGVACQDCYINEINPSTQRNGQALWAGYNSLRVRFLIKFDLTEIPASTSAVTAVTIDLYTLDKNTSNTTYCYPTLRNWVETEVTWAYASSVLNWTTDGGLGAGDYTNTVSASFVCGATGSHDTITLNADGIAVVQNFIDTPSSNLGWIFRTIPENSSGAYNQYADSENATSSYRPTISVTYTDLSLGAGQVIFIM